MSPASNLWIAAPLLLLFRELLLMLLLQAWSQSLKLT
jgi:hypothetical protein